MTILRKQLIWSCFIHKNTGTRMKALFFKVNYVIEFYLQQDSHHHLPLFLSCCTNVLYSNVLSSSLYGGSIRLLIRAGLWPWHKYTSVSSLIRLICWDLNQDHWPNQSHNTWRHITFPLSLSHTHTLLTYWPFNVSDNRVVKYIQYIHNYNKLKIKFKWLRYSMMY